MSKAINDITVARNSIVWMRFPYKLWKIVHECDTGAIQWNREGTGIVIDYAKFQTQYLNQSGNNNDKDEDEETYDVFKTSNIKSFIRQLNLYKFQKRRPQSHQKLPRLKEVIATCGNCGYGSEVNEFRNAFFLRGRPELLVYITRKIRIASNKNESMSYLEMCQKSLTEALENAVMRKSIMQKHSYYFHEDCLQLVLDVGSEALIDKFVQYDDTELLTKEFPLNLESIELPSDQNEVQHKLEVKDAEIDFIAESLTEDSLIDYDLGFCSDNLKLPINPITSEELEIAFSSLQEESSNEQHDNAESTCGIDYQTSWDDVMNLMDNAFADNMYTMLLNGSDGQREFKVRNGEHQLREDRNESSSFTGHSMERDALYQSTDVVKHRQQLQEECNKCGSDSFTSHPTEQPRFQSAAVTNGQQQLQEDCKQRDSYSCTGHLIECAEYSMMDYGGMFHHGPQQRLDDGYYMSNGQQYPVYNVIPEDDDALASSDGQTEHVPYIVSYWD